jgi:hypothetical protein
VAYKKILNWLFFFIFITALLFIPIRWIAQRGEWQARSEIEVRNLALFPTINQIDLISGMKNLLRGNIEEAKTLIINQFLDQSFQNAVSAAAVDQFPYRITLTSAGRALERALILTAYGIFKDPAIPASLDTEYLIMRDEPVFIQYPALLSYISRSTIDKRIQNYQELIHGYPKIKFFVFYLERMAFAPYNPAREFFPEADNGTSFQYFLDNKPEMLNVSAMRLGSYQDHKAMFFRTDHHWNSRGAWKGYSIIYDMLAEQIPEISPKLILQEFRVIEGAAFCGSYSRRTLVPCVPEPFEVPLVKLPQYSTIIDGQELPYGHREQYLTGEFERNQFTNHYAEYYGNVIDLVEYQFENGSERDLLLIGDSYSQAAQLFIAAHYRHTYVLDFREYSDFYLSKFLAEHPVDDILLMGDVKTYGREEWLINP